MRMLLSLLRNEARACLADPRRFIFLFLASLIYMFLFSVLYAPGGVKGMTAMAVDEDQSRLSRQVLTALRDQDSFMALEDVPAEEDLRWALLNGKACIGVMVPHHFARDVKLGRQASVLFLLDGQNLVTTSQTARDGERVMEEFSNRQAARRLALRTGADEGVLLRRVAPMQTSLRVLGNPTQDYVWFFVIGLATAAYQQGLFFAAAATLFQREPEEVARVSPGRRLAAKFLFVALMGLVSMGILLAMLHGVLDVPLRAGAGRLALFCAPFTVAVTGLGFFAASWFRTELSFVAVSLAYPVMGFVLSGYTWPSLAMPRAVRWFADIFPQTWFMSPFRDLLLVGDSALWPRAAAVLACMGAGFLLAAFWAGRRRLRLLAAGEDARLEL